ncbi:type II toxin-antitoxin system RelE/ParE family toxin [Phenylobacterium sp. 20VBR1]|uniref:Type II toxin-antitoxin system RelE/ParE family toxin n=1 Tax=Phenylobacterium glaciei TaxID=2803784 RepID=A0A941HXJ0_9CAUL|nr:type II toxin-antitoxin system RelE/ParE family toxin [Phenylobacterium glaciei]MBR7620372.1 type II toxin-antitoxin system RelE/ParE family toxin [Phenylobacterium glaciei]QQZ49208.1 type II toxin-antitoxin system RelE/ParE family toxin [Phenylobacterium glaciei]
MEIVRTATYARNLKRLGKLGATEADVIAMENAIAASPEAGAVIRGSGGMRKIRFGFGGSGKSGGGRTIYYAITDDEVVYLITAYAKVDKSDLTPDEIKLFKTLIEELTR